MKRSIGLGALLLAVLACGTVSPDAFAATRTWTGGVSPLWSSTGNWSGGVAPVAGDDLVFPGGTPNTANVNDYPSGTSFASVSVAGEHQITGNAITLTAAAALTFSSPAAATITFNPSVTLSNAAATIATNQVDGTGVYVNVGGVTIAGGTLNIDVVGNLAQVYFTQEINETSAAALVKTGVGEALFQANNTYSGITTINGGYIGVGANGGLGVGTNIAANGTVVNSNGTLFLFNGAQVANERVVLNGSGASGNGSFQSRSGAASWGGDVVLADNALSLNALGTSLAITGKITGPGSFRFGRSPVTLSNSSNDYGGGTVLGSPSGTNTILILGANEVIPDGSYVQVLGGVDSTLDVNGRTETIGSLGGTGNVNLNGGELRTGGDNTTATFFGTFLGTGIVRKVGTTTWTLGGSSPAFTGTLEIASGTVLVNGPLGGTAAPGGGGILGGSGTVGAIATASLGNGIVAPGTASTGTLTASGVVLAAGNTLRVRLNGTTAGALHDQLVVGSATLQGTLEVTLGFIPSTGDVFRVVDNTGAGAIVSTFAGLPEGATFTVGTTQFRISYVGGTGNDVTLTVVPAGPGAPSITTTSPLPSATVGTAYATTIVGSGGTPAYVWSVTAGALPAGLTLTPGSGVIGGTPTAAGTFNFTVTLTDQASQTVSKPFTLVVAPAGLTITTSSLPGGIVGAPYAGTIAATGGTPPYTWAVATGALPPGVTLNSATGALGGTPTTAGTYAFSVSVSDSVSGATGHIAPKAMVTAPFTISILAADATQPIPTLGEWMLILLAMLTAGTGMLAMRRR